ncbi:MAG: outer membrane lipid asymmetry maintenance protein MlaD [Desulfuromonadales bacterium]|nr:outer membrane lipid asymmetry maintenance protein MlaD [Desulfuromonadales bacterium]
MRKFNVEIAVGIFLVIGFLSFAWLAVNLGDVKVFGKETYSITARFGSVSGLREGAVVQIAGVRIGQVTGITLDPEYYEAIVEMALDAGVAVQEDSIASIRTTGIIGEKYVNISPGGSPENLQAGGTIIETEPSISLEELISRYIFEGK